MSDCWHVEYVDGSPVMLPSDPLPAQILQPPPRSLSPLERHMLEALRAARHAMAWAQTSAGNRDHRRMLDQAAEQVREAIHAAEAVR